MPPSLDSGSSKVTVSVCFLLAQGWRWKVQAFLSLGETLVTVLLDHGQCFERERASESTEAVGRVGSPSSVRDVPGRLNLEE